MKHFSFSFSIFVFVLHAFSDVLHVQPRVSALTTYRYIRRADRQIKPQYVLEQHVLRSKLECITACSSNYFCLSASWSVFSNVCFLTDKDTVDFGVDNKYLKEAENWDTMAKIRYNVVMYRGPLGRYSMTFNEAALLCAQYKTDMASPTDLLDARSKGYHLCNCGWLSDGTRGFVLQQSSSCWYHFTTGIHYCGNELANVYCLLP